ncbi:MAG: hypothetical protein MH252_01845 [Thermosynechococcaceae cyanobacterium MS004]|nr:hypothetical protein [Thermosynechococcaceae cyanobacterium MS004]
MDRERVKEVYKVDDFQYERTCAVIGLWNPSGLTGEKLDQFERVRLWFDTRQVHTFEEASDRFEAEAELKPKAVSDELLETFEESAEFKADSAMVQVLSVLKDAESKVQEKALNAFYARAAQIAQSPEYQEKLRKACEGEEIEDDFSSDDGGASGLASIAATILHQQLMIFCHKHRAILQCRADALKIRERQLKQQLHYKEQTLKAIQQLSKNILGVVGALSLVAVLGVVVGVNYPAAIACAKGDTVCSLRFRGGVVEMP